MAAVASATAGGALDLRARRAAGVACDSADRGARHRADPTRPDAEAGADQAADHRAHQRNADALQEPAVARCRRGTDALVDERDRAAVGQLLAAIDERPVLHRVDLAGERAAAPAEAGVALAGVGLEAGEHLLWAGGGVEGVLGHDHHDLGVLAVRRGAREVLDLLEGGADRALRAQREEPAIGVRSVERLHDLGDDAVVEAVAAVRHEVTALVRLESPLRDAELRLRLGERREHRRLRRRRIHRRRLVAFAASASGDHGEEHERAEGERGAEERTVHDGGLPGVLGCEHVQGCNEGAAADHERSGTSAPLIGTRSSGWELLDPSATSPRPDPRSSPGACGNSGVRSPRPARPWSRCR